MTDKEQLELAYALLRDAEDIMSDFTELDGEDIQAWRRRFSRMVTASCSQVEALDEK